MSKQPKAPRGCYWRDGVLYGRVQAGGQDYRWSLRTDDPKIAASRRKAEAERVVASQRYGDQRRTFAEALEAWAGHVAKQISPKTLKRYLSSIGAISAHLDGMYLDEIGNETIAGIVKARRSTPYVPQGKRKPITVTVATIKRDLTALSSVFDFCVDESWLSTNPAMDWLKPGHRDRRKSRLQERRDPIVLPDPAHIERVIQNSPGLFGHMIRAAMLTGARLDELANAERRHLDATGRQLTVVGKRNKLRVIGLEDGAEKLFASLPAAIETRALFWHRPPKGRRQDSEPAARPYASVSSNFRRVVAISAKQAQKQAQDFRPFRFHDLRHVHAVNWLKSGRSIYDLQQRLGHTSVKTTEIYLAYLTPEERQKAMFGRTAEGTNSGTSAAVENG